MIRLLALVASAKFGLSAYGSGDSYGMDGGEDDSTSPKSPIEFMNGCEEEMGVGQSLMKKLSS